MTVKAEDNRAFRPTRAYSEIGVTMLKDIVQSGPPFTLHDLAGSAILTVIVIFSGIAFATHPDSHPVRKTEYLAYFVFLAATGFVMWVALTSNNSRAQHLADWIFLAATGIFMLTLILQEVRKVVRRPPS